MKLFYLFLLVALPSMIFAQANYHAGYVLKNNGDTLKGYIDYREWLHSPTAIDFKTNIADKQPTSFDPGTIKKFQITGLETYVSYAGIVSMNKNHFPDLAEESDTSTVYSTVFLKQLVTGSHITLYSEIDDRKTRYFIEEDHQQPVELKYYQYYSENGIVVEHPTFRGQLILLVNKFRNGDAGLLNEVRDIKFEQPQLVSFIDEINGAGTAEKSAMASENKAVGLRWFVGADLNHSNLTSVNFWPSLEFGMDILANPNVQQFVVRTSVSLSSVNPSYYYSSGYPATYQKFQYSQTTASITPQAIFNVFNKDEFKIYIDGGLTLNISGYSNNVQLPTFWFNVYMQAGVVINKQFDIAVGYYPGASYSGSAVNNRSVLLGVKFFLNKK